jgi:hypothetical protein
MPNFIIVSIAAVAIIGAVLWLTGWGYDAASVVAAQAGIPLMHDKLGWMDDDPLTDADRQRIAEITGNPYSDNLGVIRAIQSGARGNLREARCTQVPPMQGAMVLADRALPVKPIVQQQQANRCVQGGTLMPGQSCFFP